MCKLSEQNDFLSKKKEEVKGMGTATLNERMQAIKTSMDSLEKLGLDNNNSYRWLKLTLNVYVTESVARILFDEKVPMV